MRDVGYTHSILVVTMRLFGQEQLMEKDPVLVAMAQSSKLQAVREDVEKNGPMAILKYAKDPEALKVFEKLMAITMKEPVVKT